MEETEYDTVVVGCGIAGLTAGLRAAELGHAVAMLEKSPEEQAGGHTRFSESFRVPSADTDISDQGYEFDVADYTPEEFYEDIMDQTNGKADSDLAQSLVENAGETIEWLTSQGVQWDMEPLAAGYVSGRTWFDGEELVPHLLEEAEKNDADVYYNAEARRLLQNDDLEVTNLIAHIEGERVNFSCDNIILASGGYESNPEKRTKYYGSGYDEMKVRGSRYNTGEAIDAAIDAGANAVGQWSGAHMAIIDAESPDVEGGANRVDGYQFGLLLNVNGDRFVDEGQDARTHTYAKFGREIFGQPEHLAYIIIDSQSYEYMRATGPSEPASAESLEELFSELDLDTEKALETTKEYNESCDPGEFNPDELDGNSADIEPPKSNWAIGLTEPPYYAYRVTGGITFAYGGVEITPEAEVLDSRSRVIPGFYAAGNCTGGLFFDNYPGGTGLMNAATFGKIAAEKADENLRQK